MKTNRNITNLQPHLVTNGQLFEEVQNSRYLGALINLKKKN